MRRLAIPIVLLLSLVLLLAAVGCEGGEDDEAKIRELHDEQIAAMNDIDVQTVYDQRTPGYRSRVTAEEFEAFVRVAYADFLPAVESGQAEIEFTDFEIEVEGEWAYVTGNLEVSDTVLLEYTDESPDIWHKIDGTWYNVETSPMFPGYDPSELPD
jgi:hypothetical protein